MPFFCGKCLGTIGETQGVFMRYLWMISILIPLNIGAQTITTSGLSAGAYMAQQFQMAHSGSVSGVAVLAGGPFFCARNQLIDAMNRCMNTVMGLPKKEDSIAEARRAAIAGEIDSLENMKHARVLVLAGTEDKTVHPDVGGVLVDTYRDLGIEPSALRFVNTLKIGHAFPTESFGNPCPTPSQPPYISACGRDMAGEILTHLHGTLNPKKAVRAESFKRYEQLSAVELDEEKANISLGKYGYAYIPAGCENGNCSIHVAFHGCKQSIDDVQQSYIKETGLNAWAEGNRIIILYPQVVKSFVPNNPNACWDWWGYTGAKYHTKNGAQMKVVMKNVEDLKSGRMNFLPMN